VTTGPSRQDEEKKKQPPGFGTVNKFYREFGPFLTLGFQLAAAVIVFYFIGSWVDRRFDTEPAFTLLGIMLGTVGGLIKFFTTVSKFGNKKESQKDESHT